MTDGGASEGMHVVAEADVARDSAAYFVCQPSMDVTLAICLRKGGNRTVAARGGPKMRGHSHVMIVTAVAQTARVTPPPGLCSRPPSGSDPLAMSRPNHSLRSGNTGGVHPQT